MPEVMWWGIQRARGAGLLNDLSRPVCSRPCAVMQRSKNTVADVSMSWYQTFQPKSGLRLEIKQDLK